MLLRRNHWFGVVLIAVIGCGASTAPPSSSNPQPGPSTGAPEIPVATVEKTAAPETAHPEPESPFQLEEGFTLIPYQDFDAFGAESDTWTATEDGVKCSGKPRGYLYTKQSYQNFTLRLDYRFPKPASLKDDSKFKGNTGFLVYITGEHKLWPICLEVQGKHVQMAAIKENGGAQPVTATDDDEARQKARKPVGQWNSLEIVSTDGALSVTLNGTPISKSEPDFISEGAIGIQAEDHPFEVRRIRIQKQ